MSHIILTNLFRHAVFSLVLMSVNLTIAQSGLTIDINQIDANNFPFIFSTVTVEENGVGVENLNTTNFVVLEDGRIQTDYFDVVPPNIGGGVRLVDFVFLIDNSGSMGGEIAAVRNNVNAFASQLAASGFDIRLGAVRFGQSANGGAPEIYNNGNMTDNLTTFQSWINSMSAGGGFEPGLLAIYQAATTFNFRPGSQRHFLLITDEDSDGGSLQQSISTCLSGNIVVHCAVDCNFYYPNAYNHYCSPTSISGSTGGMVFTVAGPYDAILNAIGQAISNTYVVRYKTDNPVYDGQQRTVVIEVTHNNNTTDATGYYTPGAGPQITLITDVTSPVVQGAALPILVDVTDQIPPGIAAVYLYYRKVGQQNYSRLTMSNTVGDRFTVNIPAVDVITPGIQFYVTATDGQLTSTLPNLEPGTNPYNIAVLPNVAPVINHTPITNAAPNTDLAVTANVSDQTYALTEAKLFYRKTGTLVYSSISMTDNGNNDYSAVIPSQFVTTDGIDYFIRAVDDLTVSATVGPFQVQILLASGLTLIVNTGYMLLNWDPYRLEGYSFKIERKDENSFEEIGNTVIANYQDSNAISGIRNYYGIKIVDQYGNESDISNIVSALTHNFLGFSPPLHKETRKLGSTIPVKFQLKDSTNIFVSDAETEIYLTPVDEEGNPIGPTIAGTGRGNDGNHFRYDNLENQYIFNLITKNLTVGRWEIAVLINDGTTHRTTINLR